MTKIDRLYSQAELMPLVRKMLEALKTKKQNGMMTDECAKFAQEHPWALKYVGHTGEADNLWALLNADAKVEVREILPSQRDLKGRRIVSKQSKNKVFIQISLPSRDDLFRNRVSSQTVVFVEVKRGMYQGQQG